MHMSDTGKCNMTADSNTRKAWIQVGGFVAAADGLSDDERGALAGAAAGPDFSADETNAALAEAAGWNNISDDALALVKAGDISFHIDCLLDIYRAVSVDGMSGTEWSRFCAAAAAIIGDGNVHNLVKTCVLQTEAASARTSAVLG